MNIFEEVFEGYDIEREPCSEQDFEGWESYWWPPSESLSRATERKCLREGECPQQGHGAPMQGRMHGVQEAADGAQAVQHKTPAGVVRIRRHRAAGTCDAYCERGCDDLIDNDQRFPFA